MAVLLTCAVIISAIYLGVTYGAVIPAFGLFVALIFLAGSITGGVMLFAFAVFVCVYIAIKAARSEKVRDYAYEKRNVVASYDYPLRHKDYYNYKSHLKGWEYIGKHAIYYRLEELEKISTDVSAPFDQKLLKIRWPKDKKEAEEINRELDRIIR